MSDRKLDTWIGRVLLKEAPVEVRDVWGQKPCSHPMDRKTYYKVGEEEIYPNYTYDMNEAIRLINKVEGLHGVHELLREDGSSLWAAVQYGCSIPTQVKASTPAMAICLAAYKLKTGEEWK